MALVYPICPQKFGLPKDDHPRMRPRMHEYCDLSFETGSVTTNATTLAKQTVDDRPKTMVFPSSIVYRPPSKDCDSRLSNSPSISRYALSGSRHNVCLSPSDIIPEGGILPRPQRTGTGSDSTLPSVTTMPTNSSCRFIGESKEKLFFTGFIFHRMKYGEYNAINIIRHFIIPKADDFVTL